MSAESYDGGFDVAVIVGNLLDEVADVIIVSANPWLNMSGGVNGALLSRGGESVQAELHDYLRSSGKSAVEAGTVVRTGPGPLKSRHILHAVAIDPFYESSVQIIERTVAAALTAASALRASTIAMPALATGYGRLSMEDFAVGLDKALRTSEWETLERLTVVVRTADAVDAICRVFNVGIRGYIQ